MVEAPLTKQQAATLCNCQPEGFVRAHLQPLMRATRYALSMMDQQEEQIPISRTRPWSGPQPLQCLTAFKPYTGSMKLAAPRLLAPQAHKVGEELLTNGNGQSRNNNGSS